MAGKKVIIWMHGLGAMSSDMEGLSKALTLDKEVRHHCLQAPIKPVSINQGYPMPAWYDIFSLERGGREDELGIKDSNSRIRAEIEKCVADGYKESDILLSGFSQGGAMALYTALNYEKPLAGVIALSAYLPLHQSFNQQQVANKLKLPIFMAHGRGDEVVPLDFGLASKLYLERLGFNCLSAKLYPMGHEVSAEEVDDLSCWLNALI